MSMRSLPESSLIRAFEFPNHRAELYDLHYRPLMNALIVYKFVMVVSPKKGDAGKMFIACETSLMAIQSGDPPFLCVYDRFLGGSHANYGSSPDWLDIDKFVARATSLIPNAADESDVVPSDQHRSKQASSVGPNRGASGSDHKWWQFWKR